LPNSSQSEAYKNNETIKTHPSYLPRIKKERVGPGLLAVKEKKG